MEVPKDKDPCVEEIRQGQQMNCTCVFFLGGKGVGSSILRPIKDEGPVNEDLCVGDIHQDQLGCISWRGVGVFNFYGQELMKMGSRTAGRNPDEAIPRPSRPRA